MLSLHSHMNNWLTTSKRDGPQKNMQNNSATASSAADGAVRNAACCRQAKARKNFSSRE